MAESENDELLVLYATILFACIVGLAYEIWKWNQFGQWEFLPTTATALISLAAAVFLILELRKRK